MEMLKFGGPADRPRAFALISFRIPDRSARSTRSQSH